MQRPEPSLSLFLAFLLAGCAATNPSATSSPAADSATFDSDGTAHITRVVPMPATISPEARKWLQSLEGSNAAPETLEIRRKRTDEWRAKQSAEARRLFPVNVEETTIGGVRADIITPLETPSANRNRVLINLHGGRVDGREELRLHFSACCSRRRRRGALPKTKPWPWRGRFTASRPRQRRCPANTMTIFI